MASGTKSWNNISPSRTLTAGIGTGDVTLNLSGSTTDYPTAPFGARITSATDPTVYEVVLVTAKAGTTLTVTRGYNGTTAQTFLTGAIVEHTVIAEDMTDIPYPDQTNTWSSAQTFSAAATFSHASGVTTDTITERTAAAGVTIDGVLLKDTTITLTDVVLRRDAADVLRTPDNFYIGTQSAGTDEALRITGAGGSSPTIEQREASGALVFQTAASSYLAFNLGSGTQRLRFDDSGGSSVVQQMTSSAALILRTAASSYMRFDTGGSGAGNERMRLIEADPASATSAMELQYHNGTSVTKQRVTIGAADSGGSGFKVLRVPN